MNDVRCIMVYKSSTGYYCHVLVIIIICRLILSCTCYYYRLQVNIIIYVILFLLLLKIPYRLCDLSKWQVSFTEFKLLLSIEFIDLAFMQSIYLIPKYARWKQFQYIKVKLLIDEKNGFNIYLNWRVMKFVITKFKMMVNLIVTKTSF